MKPSRALSPPTQLPNGRKSYTINGVNFEVPEYLELQRSIGFGAYGLVCSALDVRHSRRLAIKKCKSVFNDTGDCKRVLREVRLLRLMQHENILRLHSFYVASGVFQDVYIVTDLLDTDLSHVIRSKQPISIDHVKYFVYQILRGLKYIHSASVVHRDIKPQNVLVNLNCDVRICDFGLARGLNSITPIEMTDYVVTRWYRPPELIMMNKHYGAAVDIWSTGCVFAEMINRRPLFQGTDYIAQLKLICESIGVPDMSETQECFENKEAVNFIVAMDIKNPKGVANLISSDDSNAFDFLGKMLAFSPQARATAATLMEHPFLKALHDPNDEPSCPTMFTWEYDTTDDISKEKMRELFIDEAASFSEASTAKN
jgi:mitogen-activated protein kinase 1/3